jgi:PIN domain nuclease of toxin-antitoxin system
VRALLDTHVFLWWITNDRRLSTSADDAIRNPDVELLLSTASAWEIAIKAHLGKLRLSGEIERFIPHQLALNHISPLPAQLAHALRVHALPDHHRDPFDRLLVAQSQVEQIPIITGDEHVTRYDVRTIW